MSIRGRILLVSFGTLAIATVLGCLFPDRIRQMGFDFWNTYRYRAELVEEEARAARLEVVSSESIHRLVLKTEITKDIIAERMTLAEATEEFLVLNQANEDVTDMVRLSFPAPTAEESTILQVLAFVRVRLQEFSTTEQEQVMSRLSCEQQAMESTAPERELE